jgi:transcription termination factor Rho
MPTENGKISGLLELHEKGYGFLRDLERGYRPDPRDPFVPPNLVRQLRLRPGSVLEGPSGPAGRPGTGPQLVGVSAINGMKPEDWQRLPLFEDGIVIDPQPKLTFETVTDRTTTRVVDLLIPIGRGQRTLIVAPPRTGKTVLMEHLAHALTLNHKDVRVIMLLVDERPEEMTHFKRAIPAAEVVGSTNDAEAANHIRIARLAIDRAKRIVETWKHVVVFLDSITRLARAYNRYIGGSGRTMTGGLDVKAMDEPKRIFGAARNIEGCGSLTIVGTALIDTGSRADEFIFQEFKGTGNMELVLSRELADRRIWPAIDLTLSGTRKEELLLDKGHLEKMYRLRRALAGRKPAEVMEMLLVQLARHKTNREFLASLG